MTDRRLCFGDYHQRRQYRGKRSSNFFQHSTGLDNCILRKNDSKRFGKPFEIFDAAGEMCFGSGHWHGVEEIRANLQKLDGVMDTKHVVDGFWDAGEVKIIRGRVEMTKHDTGETVTPAMVHIFTMSPNEPGKVRQTYGAVGPEKL